MALRFLYHWKTHSYTEMQKNTTITTWKGCKLSGLYAQSISRNIREQLLQAVTTAPVFLHLIKKLAS